MLDVNIFLFSVTTKSFIGVFQFQRCKYNPIFIIDILKISRKYLRFTARLAKNCCSVIQLNNCVYSKRCSLYAMEVNYVKGIVFSHSDLVTKYATS